MRKMKESGIDWIGAIPEDWNIRKLFGLLSNIGSGTTPKGKDEYYDGNIPWLNTGDLNDGYITQVNKSVTDTALSECSALKMYQSGSVIIAMYGATIGKLGINTFDLTTNQACCVMTCSNDIINKFLFYVLWSCKDYFIFSSYGSGQPNISQDTIRNLKIALPKTQEQHAIVQFLDNKCKNVDGIINGQKRIIEGLYKYKASVIAESVTKGLISDRKVKDSCCEFIGQVPEEWQVMKFGRCVAIKSNLVPPEDYAEYPQISPEHIEKNSGRLLDTYTTVKESGVISGNHLFFEGQIIYSKIRPMLNKVTIAPFDGLCSADMYPIETDNHTRFILYMMLSDYFTAQVGLVTENRVKMPKINQNELSSITVALPPMEEQKQIADYLDKKCAAIDDSIAKRQQLIDKLTEYKKSLIFEVVTGKKEV